MLTPRWFLTKFFCLITRELAATRCRWESCNLLTGGLEDSLLQDVNTNVCQLNNSFIWCLPTHYNQEKHPFTCRHQAPGRYRIFSKLNLFPPQISTWWISPCRGTTPSDLSSRRSPTSTIRPRQCPYQCMMIVINIILCFTTPYIPGTSLSPGSSRDWGSTNQHPSGRRIVRVLSM